MDADSELKPSGDGPTAARHDVAPARERLVRALLSAQMSKSIPEEEKLRALNSAVKMKDQSIDDILRLARESHSVGYLDRETTTSMGGAYLAAQKILGDMLIKLGADPRDLEIAQAAIRVATSISIQAGSASPTQTSLLKRFLMQAGGEFASKKGIQQTISVLRGSSHYCVFCGSIAYKGKGMQND